MHPFFFYLFASLLILASVTVIRAKNPLYNVLGLVLAIFSLASLFILLQAFFVGMILVLVYAGAVLVFFLFVVMCLNLKTIPAPTQERCTWLGWFAGAMFITAFFCVMKSFCVAQTLNPATFRGTIEKIGEILFIDYVLPFELTSFLLLIAIFGILSLAQGMLSTTSGEPSQDNRQEQRV